MASSTSPQEHFDKSGDEMEKKKESEGNESNGEKNDGNKSDVSRQGLYIFSAIFISYAIGVGVNLAFAWLTGYKGGSASLTLGDKGLEMKFDFCAGGSDGGGSGGGSAAA